jgi:hypothetical protein
MQKYWFILRCSGAYSKIQRAAALRNLLRLVVRYEEISQKLGITVAGSTLYSPVVEDRHFGDDCPGPSKELKESARAKR